MNVVQEPGPARDIEAERTLIATFMHFPARISEALDVGLTVEHFSLAPHGAIVTRIFELDRAGEPVDLRSVLKACEARGQLEFIGGADYLLRLDRNAVAGLDVPGYARQIVVDAARRRLPASR